MTCLSRARHLLPFALGASALLTLTGCPNPNTYGVPRTVAPGKVQHTLAAEGIYVRGDTPTESVSAGYPMLPTYQARVGVADKLDLGFRLANLSTLGADVKWNFVRSRSVDLAIDPGLQAFAFSANGNTIGILYFHVPLLVGVNVTDDFTIVFTPGFVQALALGSTNATGRDAIVAGSNTLGRLGAGFDIRFSDSFALHPEVTAMQSFDSTASTIVVGGLGFNFGTLPDYSSD